MSRSAQTGCWTLCLAAVVFSACSCEGGKPPRVEKREWLPELLLALGETEATALGSVVSAAILSDGSVAVLDGMARSLRVADPAGAWAWTFGRRGAGPEEISDRPDAVLLLPTGELVLVDQGNARMTKLSAGGAVLDSWRLELPGVGRNWRSDGAEGFLHDTFTRPEVIVRRAPNSAVLDTLFRFEYPRPSLGTQARPLAPLFSPEGRWCLGPGGALVAAVSTEPVLHEVGPSGVRRELRLQNHRVALGASEKSRLLEIWQERLDFGDIPPRFAELIEVVMPERMPAMGHITCRPNGEIWVQRPPRLESMDPAVLAGGLMGGTGDRVWDRYRLDEGVLGSVRFPNVVRILGWGPEGAFLSVRRDPLGREILEKWRVSEERAGVRP